MQRDVRIISQWISHLFSTPSLLPSYVKYTLIRAVPADAEITPRGQKIGIV